MIQNSSIFDGRGVLDRPPEEKANRRLFPVLLVFLTSPMAEIRNPRRENQEFT